MVLLRMPYWRIGDRSRNGLLRTGNDSGGLYKPTKEQEAEAKRRAEAREAEERKRKEKEAERDRAYRRYIDLSREIADAENDIREFAPKKFDDDFDVRYINAVEKIDRLREEAKDLELVIYEKGEER